MKRHLGLVVLSLAALLGNLAWAGSVREDATERLQNSAYVLKEIAAAPDKGIPEEVLNNSKCHRGGSASGQGRFHRRRQARTWSRGLSHGCRMERARLH